MGVDSGDDRALLARVAAGDRAALEALYRHHAGWLTARLQHRCTDADTVDIAVQDTFLSVWRTAGRYRGDGAVAAWLWGIAVRRLVDQLRRQRPTPVAPESIVPQAVTFEEQLLGSGAHGSVAPHLRSLAPDLQAVLLAVAVDGLSTREAAVLLGWPHGTVKTRLARARVEMRKALT